jgi:NosR/NirI family transcriptional regulator, nitrous oxide reductase regulator
MMTAPSEKNVSPWRRRWQRWGVGGARLAMIAVAMGSLYLRPEKEEVDLGVLLAEGKKVFFHAQSLGEVDEGWHPLLDAEEELLGWVTGTNPQARKVQGYAGPSELVVVADVQRKVRRISLLRTADTAGHVEMVRRDGAFWAQWDGKPERELGSYESPVLVSGASLTSDAMARGLAARFGANEAENFFAKELLVDDVKQWFPAASQIVETAKRGSYEVRDGEKLLGSVMRSARMGVMERGYNGASDVLVAVDADGDKVLGVALWETRDNEPYTTDVRDELRFVNGYAGKGLAEVVGNEVHADYLLVSGASMTARAVHGTVREMLRRFLLVEKAASVPWQWSVSLLWLVAGVWLGFRGGKKSRVVYALCSVMAGLVLGWMVGQDQLLGWARHGWRTPPALPLIAMTAVALLIPALTGKNVYCSRICPHGAAQTLAGMVMKKRRTLPAKWHRAFSAVPWLSLLAIWALALAGARLPFAHAEPFEVWSTGFVALLPAALFTIGIVAAFFLPQGYCHYGCPTGALLKFLTHAPGRWTRRDSIAAVLVAVALTSVWW